LTRKLTTEIKPSVLLLISGDKKTDHRAVKGGCANSLFRTLGEAGWWSLHHWQFCPWIWPRSERLIAASNEKVIALRLILNSFSLIAETKKKISRVKIRNAVTRNTEIFEAVVILELRTAQKLGW